MKIQLRALEPEDIDVLYDIENNSRYWKYSNRNTLFSKALLRKYINNQHQDIYESKQQRFVITDASRYPFGFIDLFDFEALHRRAGVGLIINDAYQGKGLGSGALELLEAYVLRFLNLHQLYAHVAADNIRSVALFEKRGYIKTGMKKDWNYYDNSFQDEYLYQKIIS